MGQMVRLWLVVAVVAVIAAAGVGVGVLVLGGDRQQHGTRADPTAIAQTEPAKAQPSAAEGQQADSEAEYEAFMTWLEEEAAKEEQAEVIQQEPEPAAPAEVPATTRQMPDLFTMAGTQPAGENVPRWRAIWADLNLTAEEQARLREGFGLLMARWVSMSPEQQAAERARFQQMRVRWEGMNDEERAATSQRMRDRFEDWRASGRVELPELTLD